MKQKTLYTVWGLLFVLCCALGFLTQRTEALEVVFTILSVLFFVPGMLLLVDGYGRNDKKALRRLRIISLCSLILSLVLLAASFASAKSSIELGNVLHYMLGVVSTPMFCSVFWALPLFLWGCLFMASFPKVVGK